MKRFNSDGIQNDYEQRGIALMRSGSYVLPTLDENELDALTRIDFKRIDFNDFPSVIVTNGTASRGNRGKLVRIAWLSKDQKYGRFTHPTFPKSNPPTYSSLSLIHATAFVDWRDFLRVAISSGQAVEAASLNQPGKRWAGILFGSETDKYSSVIFANAAANHGPFGLPFHCKDGEFEPNARNGHELIRITGRDTKTAREAVDNLASLLRPPSGTDRPSYRA